MKKYVKIKICVVFYCPSKSLRFKSLRNTENLIRHLLLFFSGLESFIKRTDRCRNNSKKLSKAKICEHVSCRHSMSLIWAFDGVK